MKRSKRVNRIQRAVLALEALQVRELEANANHERVSVRIQRIYWALQSLREMWRSSRTFDAAREGER